MVANILAQGGLDPTMVIGGKVNALGSHARLGRGELLVAEADESDGSFLRLSPTIIAVTNLDREHLDHYGSMERIYESFLEFINKVPFYGLAVLCADDHRLRGLFPNIVKRYYTYGLSESDGATPDFRATDIVAKQGGSEFRAFFRTRNLGPFRLAVPGIHNVSNALAAIAIGVELDVPVDLIRKALAAFTGVERRFHIRGESNGVMVVDDYGHHPTEIKATLAAAKQGWPERRLVVLFQPLYADQRLIGGFFQGISRCRSPLFDRDLCGQRVTDSRSIGRQISGGNSCRRPSAGHLCRAEGPIDRSSASSVETR
jgi:UDP-N-acetylmuramate--alanine ligase